nr:uncharacterized protein LOC119162377 [Rhipicephalus microplus]
MQGFCSTHTSLGPKPQPTGTSGITVGLLLAWSPPSTAKARTQFDVVCKKRRKEGYSVVDTISFVSLDKARPSEGLQHRSLPQIHRGLRLQLQVQADPCFGCYRYVLNWTRQLFYTVLDMLLHTFQWVVTGIAMRARAPTQFQNLFQSPASAYTSCIAVMKGKATLAEAERGERGGRRLQTSCQQPSVVWNPAGGRAASD